MRKIPFCQADFHNSVIKAKKPDTNQDTHCIKIGVRVVLGRHTDSGICIPHGFDLQ